jgi:hypothetical protein
MIQPCRSRASARISTIRDPASPTVPETSSSSAQVGAPPDPGLRRGLGERAVAVEHHHRGSGQALFAQPAAGGDQDRFADVVERDAVPCGERLDRGDAGDHVVVEFDVSGHPVEDAQRAVIRRRVAPSEEGADPVVGQFDEAVSGFGDEPFTVQRRSATRSSLVSPLSIAKNTSVSLSAATAWAVT